MAFIPALATTIGGFFTAAGPALTGIGSLLAGGAAIQSTRAARAASKEGPVPLPAPPSVVEAQTSAADELKRRRRISLLSGGLTDVTRGKGLVSSANVGAKKLLGE